MLGHALAQRGDDVGAEDYVLLDLGVAQVEVAVLEAGALIGLTAAVYLEGQLAVEALAEHFDALGDYLDVAGGHVGVLAGALAHHALNTYRALAGDGLEGLDHVLGLGDDLGGAVEVAHDDEGERGGDLAHVLHPAADLYLFSGVGGAELAAGACS